MSNHITKVLTDFLTNPENDNKILILKGKWGVGKTYFWENFIKSNKDIIAKAMPAYSYVSLFGVQNSLELKEKITRNLISFTGEYNQLIEETTKTNISGVLTAVSKIGWIKRQVGDLSNFLQDALIRNQVICFDDIERIDSKFPIETLMGYADELAQQKNCKIILIFNEDELEEKQKEAFNKYREKVVDIELTYSPTLNEQLEIVFGDKLIKYPVIYKVINEQEYVNIVIKNIRVLKKINQIIGDFLEISTDILPTLIIEDFIKRAIFLSKCFYETNSKVPFEITKNLNSMTAYQVVNSTIKENEKKKFKDEYDQKLYQELMLTAQQLHINRSSVFTEEIIHKLEHGVWSEGNITSFLSSEIKRIDVITKQSEIQKRLNCAWELYHSSFQNNIDDIVSIFKKELEDFTNYTYWDYGHFISTISSYYDFKKLEDPTFSLPFHYIDKYITINEKQLEQMSEDNRMYINRPDIDPSIQRYAWQKLNEVKSPNFKTPLSEFIITLHKNSLSAEQKIYIQNLTLEEIEDWLKNFDNPLMSLYISNLRSWSAYIKDGPGTNNPNADTLINQALEKVSASSPLNKYRIERLIKTKS